MEECEKEGEGLHQLWEMAEEVDPRWCRGTKR